MLLIISAISLVTGFISYKYYDTCTHCIVDSPEPVTFVHRTHHANLETNTNENDTPVNVIVSVPKYMEYIQFDGNVYQNIHSRIKRSYHCNNIIQAFICYKPHTGEIIVLFSTTGKNIGLKKQLLSKAINDMEKTGCKKVWVKTTPNHPFWSNVCDGNFIQQKYTDFKTIEVEYSMIINKYPEIN